VHHALVRVDEARDHGVDGEVLLETLPALLTHLPRTHGVVDHGPQRGHERVHVAGRDKQPSDAILDKLVRRHPHVFADGDAKTPDQVKQRWDQIKRHEKLANNQSEAGLLARVSRTQPALMEAQQLTSCAASVGFDWENPDQVLAKLEEELEELGEARRQGASDEVHREVGDLLFVLVNLARSLKVDAEQALRGTNSKFRDRFGYLEKKLGTQGKPLAEATLAEMDKLWEEAKNRL